MNIWTSSEDRSGTDRPQSRVSHYTEIPSPEVRLPDRLYKSNKRKLVPFNIGERFGYRSGHFIPIFLSWIKFLIDILSLLCYVHYTNKRNSDFDSSQLFTVDKDKKENTL